VVFVHFKTESVPLIILEHALMP